MNAEKRSIFSKIFAPQSIAIVGISRTNGGLGGQFFLNNLKRAGYSGRIYLINPVTKEIDGLKVYPNIYSLPEAVDLAIFCTPARLVPSIMEACRQRGIRNIYILSAGFKELGTQEGISLEEEIKKLAQEGNLHVVGPNCMGPYVPASKFMLWGQIPGKAGEFAFISQSGTLTQRMTEYAYFSGIGLSKAISFGNAAVLDSSDFLEYLAEDEETKIIGFYLESVKEGKRFLDLACRISPQKPLLVWKGGETPAGSAVVASHTGHISGKKEIWDRALKQAGALPLYSLEEIYGTAMAFLYLPRPRGRKVFILGGGGGNSVFYADICLRHGLQVPPLRGEVQQKISALVPEVGSFTRNPVDAWRAYYDPEFMQEVLEIVYSAPDLDMVILDRLIPRATYATPGGRDSFPIIINFWQQNRYRKPLAVVIDGSGEDPFLAAEAAKLRQQFCWAGIPAYSSLPLAAQALAHLCSYSERYAEQNNLNKK
ncbi:MAG: CoA-binding protein [Thermodesulfobacteriota bacterium]